jgi:hypothetical protein
MVCTTTEQASMRTQDSLLRVEYRLAELVESGAKAL